MYSVPERFINVGILRHKSGVVVWGLDLRLVRSKVPEKIRKKKKKKEVKQDGGSAGTVGPDVAGA